MTVDRMIDLLGRLRERVGGEAAIEIGVDSQFASGIRYKEMQVRENVETGISSVVLVVTYGK